MDLGIVSAVRTVVEDYRIRDFDVRRIDLRELPDKPQEFARLCDLHGSDKSTLVGKSPFFDWAPHDFGFVYETLLRNKKLQISSLFECGIGTNNPAMASNMTERGKPGASLRVWRDYLPNATIYGGDIDQSILFQEPRIRTAWLDQTKPESVTSFFDGFEIGKVDIIVDDGLHTLEAAICLFEAAYARLNTGGDYFIEDLYSWEITPLAKYLISRGLRPTIWQMKSKWRNSHNNNSLVQVHKD